MASSQHKTLSELMWSSGLSRAAFTILQVKEDLSAGVHNSACVIKNEEKKAAKID